MKILITGTSCGIGKAIAKLFLDNNHIVYGIDVLSTPFDNANYNHITGDIRNFNELNIPNDLDIIINNAGRQNDNDIDINLVSTVRLTEKLIKDNIKPLYSILFIGSASGHTGAEFPEYAASKGGILSYTKNVAIRLAKFGTTCNSLDPGGVLTELNAPVINDKILWSEIMELTPLKRWADPSEIAEWAYFLTVKNRFCTAQNILVDGGEADNFNFVWKRED